MLHNIVAPNHLTDKGFAEDCIIDAGEPIYSVCYPLDNQEHVYTSRAFSKYLW